MNFNYFLYIILKLNKYILIIISELSYRLAKCCLHELSNVIAVHHSLEGRSDVWATVCSVLKFVAKSWQKQEELRKQKQQEEESYFINKYV